MARRYELVVARYKEDVSWLNDVSPKWSIVIYNKSNTEITLTHPNYHVYRLGNIGREAETYAFHMKKYYGSYADLTVFIQADPFDHAPEMKELLNILVERPTFSEAERYIPMTIKYDNKIPIPKVVKERQNRFFRIDETSVYTLNCIAFEDRAISNIVDIWHNANKLPLYTNIMGHLFNNLEKPQLLTKGENVIKFHFAACFALSRDALMQYDQNFYNAMYTSTIANAAMPYIFERSWLHIFNRDFDAAAVLPEYSLNTE
jgi:hypothetical protein